MIQRINWSIDGTLKVNAILNGMPYIEIHFDQNVFSNELSAQIQ